LAEQETKSKCTLEIEAQLLLFKGKLYSTVQQ